MLYIEDKAVTLYPIDSTDLIVGADWVKTKPDGELLRLDRVSGRVLLVFARDAYSNYQQLVMMKDFSFPAARRIDDIFINEETKMDVCFKLQIPVTKVSKQIPTVWKAKVGALDHERTPVV